MNILVIGNGFDLAHNFKTSYGNFLNYVDDFNFFYKQKRIKHNHTPDISFCKDIDNTKHLIKLFNGDGSDKTSTYIIDEQHELVANNAWIPYFKERQKEINDRWVDFEAEISRVIQLLDEARKKAIADGKKRDYQKRIPMEKNIGDVLEYITTDIEDRLSLADIAIIKKWMLDDLNKLTRSYELYITSFIEDQDVDKLINEIRELSIDKVLSFNYSDTYEKWYGTGKSSIEYDYIHGKAGEGRDIDSCNMVLGIEEYLEEPYRSTDNEYIEFKKFYQRIYKQTGCKYMTWLGQKSEFYESNLSSKPEEINIYFYGHSLAVTDGDIIANLIRQKLATTTIYYHSKKALGDQIANLVKILGEEELIQRTGSYKPSIIFKPCTSE